MSNIFNPPSPPRPQAPPPPPNAPRQADSSIVAGRSRRDPAAVGSGSLIGTGPQGLRRRANTTRRSLIGG